MKRLLQVLAIGAAALLAVRLMAQDTGGGGDAVGGGGGDQGAGNMGTMPAPADNSDSTTPSDTGGGDNGTNGNNGGTGTNGGTEGNGGSGTSGGNGGTQGGNGEIPSGGENGNGNGSTVTPPSGTPGGPSTIVPPTSFLPGTEGGVPGLTPVPGTSGTAAAAAAAAARAAAQAAPVTFSLPGGYNGAAGQTFVLGQGRLARPPLTFTVNVSLGYNDNVFEAPSHVTPGPTPSPAPTPPLEGRIAGFRDRPPTPPTPIIVFFRPKAVPTPAIQRPTSAGVIGSAVGNITLGAQVQKGTPRTIVTADLSGGANDYFSRPGGKIDYTGNFDLILDHRLTPRVSFSAEASAVYTQTPNFALLNAPTTNTGNGGSYLNGNIKTDLSISFSQRISNVSSYSLGFNLLNQTAADNVYSNTFGTQFRYAVSARNTVTAELRTTDNIYPTNSGANNSAVFYLLGLDTFISSRLRNTISAGIDQDSYSNGQDQSSPYVEVATTLSLPRGGGLTLSNRYGSENSGNAATTAVSYRGSLTLAQPLSTKLVASFSLAYNHYVATDSSDPAGSYTQDQLQASASLGFNVSPRLTLSLSYTFTDLMTTQINSSYIQDQVFLGGTYLFR